MLSCTVTRFFKALLLLITPILCFAVFANTALAESAFNIETLTPKQAANEQSSAGSSASSMIVTQNSDGSSTIYTNSGARLDTSPGSSVRVESNGDVTAYDPDTGTKVTWSENSTSSGVVSTLPKTDGNGDFVYSDGQRVQGHDESGNPGRLDDNGNIIYDDGTVVEHDVFSGNTVVRRPDGTARVYFPDGGELEVGSNSEVYLEDDGSVTVYHRDTDVKMNYGGKYPAPAIDNNPVPKTDENGDFVFSDGATVIGHDGDGNQGYADEKGRLHYPDGTVIEHDVVSGSTYVDHPDGSGTVYLENGATLEVAPGTEVTLNPDGSVTTRSEDGRFSATFGGGSERQADSEPKPGDSNGSEDQTSSDSEQSNSNDSNDDDGSDSGDEDSADSSGEDESNDDSDGSGEDDTDTGEEGADEYRAQPGADTSNKHPGAQAIDDFVATKKGENKDVESTAPDCGDQSGGAPGVVSEPMPGSTSGSTPCVSLQTKGEGEESTPVTSIWQAPSGSTGSGSVIDPQGLEQQENFGDVFDDNPFNLDAVVNPGGSK